MTITNWQLQIDNYFLTLPVYELPLYSDLNCHRLTRLPYHTWGFFIGLRYIFINRSIYIWELGMLSDYTASAKNIEIFQSRHSIFYFFFAHNSIRHQYIVGKLLISFCVYIFHGYMYIFITLRLIDLYDRFRKTSP